MSHRCVCVPYVSNKKFRMITQNHSRCIKLNHSLPTMKLKKSKMTKLKKKGNLEKETF